MKPSILGLALIITLGLATSAWSRAPHRPPSCINDMGREIEGNIQTVNLETKRATMLTKAGKIIAFRWNEKAKFTPANAMHKGAHVKVDYHGFLFGESYVSRAESIDGVK